MTPYPFDHKDKFESLWEHLKGNHKKIIAVDSEYRPKEGGIVDVVCFVYQDLITKEVFHCRNKEDVLMLPWDHDEAVYVVFNAFAEAQCWLAWDIPLPYRIIDLWVENKNLIQDGVGKPKGFFSLLSVSQRHNIDGVLVMTEEEKEANRKLIMDREDYTETQMKKILKYCEDDTRLTGALLMPTLNAMKNRLQKEENDRRLQQIFLRGKAKSYEAVLYHNGICIDNHKMDLFEKYWPEAKKKVIETLNEKIDVYADGVFKMDKFEELLHRIGLFDIWPRTPKGSLRVDETALSRFKENYVQIKTLREMRRINDSDKLLGYNVGPDGRTRTPWNIFSTVTGRSAPSTSKCPFNSPRWTREFIKPPEGFVYGYVDYKFQEPSIQAYLSQDPNYIKACKSGDVYLATAKLVGAVPETATAKSHPEERKKYKVGVLANAYSMGVKSLASQLRCNLRQAKEIQFAIKKVYSVYFKWSDDRIKRMLKQNRLQTIFGWTRHTPIGVDVNTRSIVNWPIQATGSEMLRWAMINLIDANYQVHAIVHDAVLVLVPEKDADQHFKEVQKIMRNCSYDIVGDYVETDVEEIRGNWEQQRTPDKEGPGDMFDLIFQHIAELMTWSEMEGR